MEMRSNEEIAAHCLREAAKLAKATGMQVNECDAMLWILSIDAARREAGMPTVIDTLLYSDSPDPDAPQCKA